MKKLAVVGAGVVFVLGLIGGFWMWQDKGKAPVEPKGNVLKKEEVNNQPVRQQGEVAQESGYFFPLPDYFSRIKVKRFGQMVRATDRFDVSCGAEFEGFHTGDDLEVFPAEQNSEVAVRAAAVGKIRQVGNVSGYGGLVVEESRFRDQTVTVYYGHLDLASVRVGTGDEVEAGEVIGYLGKGCSTETSGERKHLHFAIRKGTAVDVRGYVPNKGQLDQWVDPGEALKNLGAIED